VDVWFGVFTAGHKNVDVARFWQRPPVVEKVKSSLNPINVASTSLQLSELLKRAQKLVDLLLL
jgi:hypothetical protein